MTRLLHEELSYTVRGALFDVHNRLGPMLPEKFYQQAVAIALEAQGVRCQTEKMFEVYYRGQPVGRYYVDVWLEGGKLLLELKVAPKIGPLHQAQAISYLKVTDADLAMVVNFGTKSVEIERLPNFVRDKAVPFAWEPQPVAPHVPYPELTNRLLEICHRVHFELGPGFLHQVYRRATMVELRQQEISYEYIKQVPIIYQGHQLGLQDVHLIAVAQKILLATVAVKQIEDEIKALLKARLRHLGFQFGLLVNFNRTRLEVTTVQV